MGGIRGFRVPPKYPSRLGAARTPEVQYLRQRTIKPLYLTSYLLVQACQHLWLVDCDDAAAVHLCSPYDSILAPLRRAVLVELRSFHKALSRVSPKDTLSRKLHTRRLLSTHVSVGYRQQNAGFYIAVKQLKQLVRVCFLNYILLKFYKIFGIVQSKSGRKTAYYLQKPCTCG